MQCKVLWENIFIFRQMELNNYKRKKMKENKSKEVEVGTKKFGEPY